MSAFIFTSESVSEGHPDKICDQVSDAILDLALEADPQARMACECLATTNKLVIAGEMRAPSSLTKNKIITRAREVVREIGYEQKGFHWDTMDVEFLLHAQSVDIAQGVDSADTKDEGAGDQGIMFGYACRETPVLMPAPIHYSHKVLKLLSDKRHDGTLSILGPDAKSQVSLEYGADRMPKKLDAFVLSTQHKENVSQEDLQNAVMPYVQEALGDFQLSNARKVHINPTGRFVIGGPDGDAGLTGRKIIVDTYGGSAPHGGGAFSGKDPTKVDRSAAYAARYLAKNIVAADLADRCTIQLSYAIGVSEPVSIYVSLHKTGRNGLTNAQMAEALPKVMDLTPKGIRTHLGLNKPIYRDSAAYGHFGREYDPKTGAFSWENTDLKDALHNALK